MEWKGREGKGREGKAGRVVRKGLTLAFEIAS